jgi:hypothetical protein
MRFKKRVQEECKGCWYLQNSEITFPYSFIAKGIRGTCPFVYDNHEIASTCPCQKCLIKVNCRKICDKRKYLPMLMKRG